MNNTISFKDFNELTPAQKIRWRQENFISLEDFNKLTPAQKISWVKENEKTVYTKSWDKIRPLYGSDFAVVYNYQDGTETSPGITVTNIQAMKFDDCVRLANLEQAKADFVTIPTRTALYFNALGEYVSSEHPAYPIKRTKAEILAM